MKPGMKSIFTISILLLMILAILAPGCGPPAPTTIPAPGPPPEPSTETPTINSPEPSPAQTPSPEPTSSVSPGWVTKFDISKAPAVGEVVDLTFTVDVIGPIKPVTKVWLEFERYDPAVYYPLGRGDQKDTFLEKLANDIDFINHILYIIVKRQAENQPESLVPAESVVLSGDVVWQGESLKKGDHLMLGGTVSFPEEGEWLINARWQVEGEPSHGANELYLTVNQDSSIIGWPKVYSRGQYQPPDPKQPASVVMNMSQAPLVGEPIPLTISVESIADLEQVEIFLEFTRMDGYRPIAIPLTDVMVEGESAWQGSLKKGTPVQFSCLIRFPEEGDWEINGWSDAGSGSVRQVMYGIRLNIGKEKSRFDWTTNHDPPSYDPLLPRGQPPPDIPSLCNS